MTPLHGLPTAVAAQERREPSREFGDPARALDVYAAWKSIFEAAHPSAVKPPRSLAMQPRGANDTREAPVRSVSFLAGANETTAVQAQTLERPPSAVVGPGIAGAVSNPHADLLTRQSAVAEIVPLARRTASAASRDAANVAVRIHYLGADSARSGVGPQAENVSIILEGAQVSIIVRNGSLSEAEALRTAFETARELTGRSSSLQQLTLNGRVLYEQAVSTDDAPGGFLFA